MIGMRGYHNRYTHQILQCRLMYSVLNFIGAFDLIPVNCEKDLE